MCLIFCLINLLFMPPGSKSFFFFLIVILTNFSEHTTRRLDLIFKISSSTDYMMLASDYRLLDVIFHIRYDRSRVPWSDNGLSSRKKFLPISCFCFQRHFLGICLVFWPFLALKGFYVGLWFPQWLTNGEH